MIPVMFPEAWTASSRRVMTLSLHTHGSSMLQSRTQTALLDSHSWIHLCLCQLSVPHSKYEKLLGLAEQCLHGKWGNLGTGRSSPASLQRRIHYPGKVQDALAVGMSELSPPEFVRLAVVYRASTVCGQSSTRGSAGIKYQQQSQPWEFLKKHSSLLFLMRGDLKRSDQPQISV